MVYWEVLLASPREIDLGLGHRKGLFIAKFCTMVARYIGEVSFWPALNNRQKCLTLRVPMEFNEHLQELKPEQKAKAFIKSR